MTLIMAAPNGARKTVQDHPAIPVTDAELIETAVACFDAGASALHAHIRTIDQTHLLDEVQVTSEAAGVYESDAQIDLLSRLKAPWVSVAIREILRSQEPQMLQPFFKQLLDKSRVQFILYDADDFQTLSSLMEQEIIQTESLEVLYVLGRYSANQESTPDQLDLFLTCRDRAPTHVKPVREMICAFGRGQIPCLLRAASEGMDLRIGFENGVWLPDGEIAENNAALVGALVGSLPA